MTDITIEEIIEILQKMHGEYMVAKAIAINDGSYYKNQDKFHKNFYSEYAKAIIDKIKEKENVKPLKIGEQWTGGNL